MEPASLRFGRFELQPAQRLLLVDGQPAALGARAFDVLVTLALRPGELVGKAELLDTVWAGLVVEEANLTVQVSSLRKVLGGDVIATVPGRGYRFTARIETTGVPAVGPAAAPAAVRQGPALVGRDEDLAWLDAALAEPGCLTLTGPAGVGKTSLARVLAARRAAGSVWVDLAPVGDGSLLAGELARALDIELGENAGVAGLARALGGRLLVLDNAEHLVDACATLALALRSAAPGLHLLVTSQVPLALAGERVHRVEPLPLEEGPAGAPHGALALLVERIQAADRWFQVTDENRPLLRDICRRLDGLPLALEMAAARVQTLGVSAVSQALDERFALLTRGHRTAPGRHRTLLAALDWSYGLLPPSEQRLLQACSLFAGGFTLDLALAALAPAPEGRWTLIDELSDLVDRSLVATDGQDPPRYRLLDTVRSYALRQMAGAGDAGPLRLAIAQALLALYQRAAPPGGTATDERRALDEHDNVREALGWARQHAPLLAVQLAVVVARVAVFSVWRREALQWLEECAAVVDAPDVTPPARAAWWRERARQWMFVGSPRARAMAAHALALSEALGDELGQFEACGVILQCPRQAGDDPAGLCDRMQALLERHPEWPWTRHRVLPNVRARLCVAAGDLEGALRWHQRELEVVRGADQDSVDAVECNLAFLLGDLQRHEEALAITGPLLQRLGDAASGNAPYAWQAHLQALLSLQRLPEARRGMPRALAAARRVNLPIVGTLCALLAALEGRPRVAARLLGHAQAEHLASDAPFDEAPGSAAAQIRARVLAQLASEEFDALVSAGRALDHGGADRLWAEDGPG